MKNLNIRKRLLAVLLAGGIALTSVGAALAERAPKSKQGTYVLIGTEETEPNAKLNKYYMKPGDNLNIISKKICKDIYGIEPTAKYWIVLALHSGYPKVGQPGDAVYFPADAEEMEREYIAIRKSGLLAEYIQKNGIYGSKKLTVRKLFEMIYGKYICVDDDVITKILEEQGMAGKYDAESVIETTDQLFDTTEYLPSYLQIFGPEFWYYYSDTAIPEGEDSWLFSDPEAELKQGK